uniref:Arylamine N-acetyltransferase n=1 Tax=uncultured bacterium BLR9 TaxID=506525 RepID=C0INC6_9BACT|nr:arylamine N-acetyltransferase [uncultured bacterium BLR9]
MPDQQIDLDAYCARIGYDGPREPTLAVLTRIHAAHPAAIPFENLDPLLSRGVPLDLPSIQRKLVGARRGGYCFEQNALLGAALQAMGFALTGLAGRVLLNHAPGTTRRSHMLLKVDLPEGPHIADVGLGSWALSAPLRLFDEGEQETPHGRFRILRNGDFFDEQGKIGGEWTTLYRFTLEEQIDDDYEVANWFTAAHPRSHFRHRLMVARLPKGRRLGMLNNRFSVHRLDGSVERRELGSAEEIAQVLENEFGLALPGPRGEILAALAGLIPA